MRSALLVYHFFKRSFTNLVNKGSIHKLPSDTNDLFFTLNIIPTNYILCEYEKCIFYGTEIYYYLNESDNVINIYVGSYYSNNYILII